MTKEAKSYTELAVTFTRSAWNHQVEIAQLTEVISEEFFGRIKDLVFDRVYAVVDEMRREHEGPAYEPADPYAEKESLQAAVMYPNVLLSSLFMSAYFSFEHEMTGLCHQLERIGGYGFKLRDLNHKGVPRARVYLEKVVGIKFPRNGQDARFLQQINALRNLVSHNGGYLESPDEKSEVGNFVRAEPSLSLGEENWIMFSPGFVISVAEKLQELCLEISNTVHDLDDREESTYGDEYDDP